MESGRSRLLGAADLRRPRRRRARRGSARCGLRGRKPPEALSPQREIVQRVVASDRIRVLVANEAHAAKQNVTVSVTVAQPGLRIARTCTIARVAAYRSVAGTAVFSGFGRVRLGVR